MVGQLRFHRGRKHLRPPRTLPLQVNWAEISFLCKESWPHSNQGRPAPRECEEVYLDKELQMDGYKGGWPVGK